MNNQLSPIEKETLEKNFLKQNFKFVEKKIKYLLANGYNADWMNSVLAISYVKQKKYDDAEKEFINIIKKEPKELSNYLNLANLYRETKAYNKCIEVLNKALLLSPNDIKTLKLLSALYFSLNDFEKSLIITNKILRIYPEDIQILKQKSVILVSIGEFEDALKSFKKVYELNNNKEILSDISVCYLHLGDLDKSRYFNELAKESLNAQYNLGIINLINGNFKQGWNGYEIGLSNNARILRKGYQKFEKLPNWEPDKNYDSVVLIGEQGIGDEIMFSTIIDDLSNHLKTIYYYCDPRLENIFKKKYPYLKFLVHKNQHNDENIQSKLPIGSLAKYFRNTKESFKSISTQDNYLLPSKIDKIKTIGISWHTTNKQFGPERNIDLDLFSNVLSNNEFKFLNLQYGNHNQEIRAIENRLGKEIFEEKENKNFTNIDGLAEKILKCDIVISIDNSTAHLAGYLNKLTLLLLPKVSDWRWQKSISNTLWYDSIKIIKQDIKLDWSSSIQKIEQLLNV